MALERRSYPRYTVNCAVEVSVSDNNDGEAFPATCCNLSCTSIQLECKPDLVTALLRQQRLPYSCQLAFELEGEPIRFSVPATVVTLRRLSQRQYRVVLILRHADAGQEERLDKALAGRHPIGLD